MTDSVLVVGCGFPQLGLLRVAKALGIRTIGADLNPNAIGVSEVNEFVKASTGDAEAIAQAVRKTGATGVVTSGSELALTITAKVAHELGLPFYADLQTIYRCQAKDAMRAAYSNAGLPVPQFCPCSSLNDAEQFVKTIGYPVVVKPAHGWGQRGVARVWDKSGLEKAVAEALALSAPHGGGAIVEQSLVGNEMSINGWVENGELHAYSVTDREVFSGDSPLGVMRSEITPSGQSIASVEKAIEAARKAAKALGLLRGPCYTQVCMTQSGPVVFETAARCGGGFDADITKWVSGVDLYERLLGVALNRKELEYSQAKPAAFGAAIVRFLPPPNGIVKNVTGVANAKKLPGVVDIATYVKEGDQCRGLIHAASRAAHIVCVGENRQQVITRADAAEQCIRFEIE